MLRITILCERPAGQAIGVKEALAMDIEAKYGDCRVISVEELRTGSEYEQTRMEGYR